MVLKKILTLFCYFIFGVNQIALAKMVYYDDEIETVPIIRGEKIIFRFNAEVKTVSQVSQFKIEPADLDNPNYTTLIVSPRFSKGASNVSFILSNGTVVNLRLAIVPKSIPGKTDNFFDFKPAEDRIESSNEGTKTSELALMKSMIAFEDLPGYKVRHLSKELDAKFDNFKARLEYVYIGPKLNGYIFKVTNDTKEKAKINLGGVSWGRPNRALLSQADLLTLEPKGQPHDFTYLRVVALPTVAYQNSNLPVTSIKKETAHE